MSRNLGEIQRITANLSDRLTLDIPAGRVHFTRSNWGLHSSNGMRAIGDDALSHREREQAEEKGSSQDLGGRYVTATYASDVVFVVMRLPMPLAFRGTIRTAIREPSRSTSV